MNEITPNKAKTESPASLPAWDLRDLYTAPDAPEVEADLKRAKQLADAFQTRYKGRLSGLTGEEMGAAITGYEQITEILHRLMSYAQLVYAGDVANPENGRFQQRIQEKVTDISTATLFFTLELNRIDDATVKAQMEHPQCGRYAPWIEDVRAFRDHQLADDMERLLHEKVVTGRSAWCRLFDETMATLTFPVDGEELSSSDALNRLSDPDGEVRKKAAKALGKVFGENIRIFAQVTNTLAKDKEIEDNWRRYPSPISERNLSNQVEDDVVDALVSTVKTNFPRLAHRYYRMKAKWFGVDKLNYWDRNAPLPDQDEKVYGWDEATRTVLDAYGAFSPDLASVGKRFFEAPWIDAQLRRGKAPGAFAHPTVPSAHPYLLLNFHGRTRDVMTLAHELGHGVHQVLSADQGTLLSDTPLTLAETASVFGEMLVFRSLLDNEKDPARRRVMLASKVEDMLNTVVRQIAFHEFEWRVHHERRDGELSAQRIGEIWMDIQTESLGDAFRFDPEYSHYWAYIPHFIHSPFYVYAYAFGDCLVNALYGVYQEGAPGFQAKYLDMLKAGGTLRHKALLAPFGLDASDPAFWGKGIDVVAGFISELEEVA